MNKYEVVFQGFGDDMLVLATFFSREKAEAFVKLLKDCDESIFLQVSKDE